MKIAQSCAIGIQYCNSLNPLVSSATKDMLHETKCKQVVKSFYIQVGQEIRKPRLLHNPWVKPFCSTRGSS